MKGWKPFILKWRTFGPTLPFFLQKVVPRKWRTFGPTLRFFLQKVVPRKSTHQLHWCDSSNPFNTSNLKCNILESSDTLIWMSFHLKEHTKMVNIDWSSLQSKSKKDVNFNVTDVNLDEGLKTLHSKKVDFRTN